MAKFNSQLKGTKDMMKELNNTQGRYIPVWLQPVTSRLEAALSNKKSGRTVSHGNKKRKRTSIKRQK